MRIEIYDWNRQSYVITSRNPRTLGDWFAEISNRLITADARMQDCMIRVWPDDADEIELITHTLSHGMASYQYTQDDLLEWAQQLLSLSEKMAEHDSDSPAESKTL